MNWHRYFDALSRGKPWAVRALLVWLGLVAIGLALSVVLN